MDSAEPDIEIIGEVVQVRRDEPLGPLTPSPRASARRGIRS